MTGLIVVPCRPDHARHVEFFNSLLALEKPAGTETKLYPGFFAHDNRTKGVEDALAGGAEWVFFVDDDQLFAPDALTRLLAHHADIVTCNLLTKEEPFEPYLFEHIADFGLVPLHLEGTHLRRVDACGLGGVLVNTRVFQTLPAPWFTVDETYKTDDLYFGAKARAAGLQIHCDQSVLSGHITKAVVWPQWTGTRWTTVVKLRGLEHETEVVFPAASPTPAFAQWRKERALTEVS